MEATIILHQCCILHTEQLYTFWAAWGKEMCLEILSVIVDVTADSEFVPDGYVAVDHVELDIKEMYELGKKAANTHKSVGNAIEADVASTESRCVCVRETSRTLVMTLLSWKDGLTAVFVHFSGPQTSIHYQQKVVSIFLFLSVIAVFIWLIL